MVLVGSVYSGGGGRRTRARPGQVSQGLCFPPAHHQPWTRAGSGPAHSAQCPQSGMEQQQSCDEIK